MAINLGSALESFAHRRIPAEELPKQEERTFGFDHQWAGRILSNHWRLHEDITVVIASHHYPRELRVGGHESTNIVIDLLALTDRLSRMLADNAGQRTQAEAAITTWLVTPPAQKLLQPLSASADEVLEAVSAGLLGLERDQRMSVGADTNAPS
jgi:hypothetical protein